MHFLRCAKDPTGILSSQLKSKTIIVIAGPTAVGKTLLAIELAKDFNTEIISADSRQCFKELNIGVAKPSIDQLSETRHYFINSHSIHDDLNAATFEQYALQSVNEIFRRNDVAIMVGGTGLYIKAFCQGLDEIPAVPTGVREKIVADYNLSGLAWLQEQVRINDPGYFATGEISNPQRLMRALEVKLATGRSIREYQHGRKLSRDFSIIKVGLELPKEKLRANIDLRVDDMMRRGLLQEAESLIPFRARPALRTVGYTELFRYLDGELSLDEAVVEIKKNTRQYAKRQMTWFRKDPSLKWFSPMEKQEILRLYHS